MTLRFAYRLLSETRDECLLPRVAVASTFWQRWRGLQMRQPLEPDQGLLLRPARSIHTHWMRFSLDVAWLDAEQRIVDLRRAIAPWRFATGPASAQEVLETLAGTLDQRWRVGMRVWLESVDDASSGGNGVSSK